MLRIAALRSFSNAAVVMVRALFAATPISNQRPRLRRLGMVHVVPDFFLGEIQKPGQHDEEDHDLKAEPLAGVERRLRRPHQEGGGGAVVLIYRRARAGGAL